VPFDNKTIVLTDYTNYIPSTAGDEKMTKFLKYILLIGHICPKRETFIFNAFAINVQVLINIG